MLALKQSAAQCQLTITAFLDKTTGYQSHLLCTNEFGDTVQSRWKKDRWAICKKKNVVLFHADLSAHTQSIQLLLSTVQMKNNDLRHKRLKDWQGTLYAFIQGEFSSLMAHLTTIANVVTPLSAQAQAQACLAGISRITSMNIRIFQVVLEIQNMLKTAPAQVELQKPVILNDALGRYCPFHLEFIKSWEALVSVLTINFKHVLSATERIQNGNFAICDRGTKRDIDLRRPWDECFRPGQRVDMSMLLPTKTIISRACPSCNHPCAAKPDNDIEW